MTLKIKLEYKDNLKYKNNKDKEEAFFASIKKLKEALNIVDPSRHSNIVESFKQTITAERKKLHALPQSNKRIKEFTVKSNKNWRVFNEEIHPDWGTTVYGPSEDYIIENENCYVRYNGKGHEIKVDTSIPFQKDVKVSEQINNIRETVLQELREHRKKSKSLDYVENKKIIKGVPYPAYFKVYRSGPTRNNEEVTDKYGNKYNVTCNNNYNIHIEKGEILRLQRLSNTAEVFTSKAPLTNEHHVGIELEFISKADKLAIAEKLVAEGVHKFVTLKDDGSLRSEGEYKYAHELCVVTPEPIVYAVLRKVLKVINDLGSKVNSKCGTHVHLDMRTRDHELCFNNLVRSQNMLYAINPASRMTGKQADGSSGTVYSKKVEYSDFNEHLSNTGGGSGARYYGINAQAYSKFKTIEIRIHSGTINARKLENWITILLGIVNCTEKYTREVTKLDSFIDRFKLSDDVKNYMEERMKLFKDKDGKHISIDEVA